MTFPPGVIEPRCTPGTFSTHYRRPPVMASPLEVTVPEAAVSAVSVIPPDERDPYSPAAGRTPDQVRRDIAALTAAAHVLTGVLQSGLHPTFARAIERSRDRMEADAFELHVALRTHRAPEFRGPDLDPLAGFPDRLPPCTSTPLLRNCDRCDQRVPDSELVRVPGVGLCCDACAAKERDHD